VQLFPPILSPSSEEIAEANPRQLVLTMGSLGVRVVSSAAFLPASRSNSMIDGSQICFGTIGFRPQLPTRIMVFANIDREMDLTFRSLNFCVRSQGSLLLSDLIYLGRSVDKTAAMTISKSSSSEAHSPVSIKPVESEGDLANLLDEISYKLDFEDVSDLPRQNGGSHDNFDFNSNFDSEEAFTELLRMSRCQAWNSRMKTRQFSPRNSTTIALHDTRCTPPGIILLGDDLESITILPHKLMDYFPPMYQTPIEKYSSSSGTIFFFVPTESYRSQHGVYLNFRIKF
jgi:hypothetical protein